MPKFHAWCEQDGKIVYDPQWKGGETRVVKETWELSDVPCYEPFDLMKQIECAKKSAGYVKHQAETNIKKGLGDNALEVWHTLFPEGQEGYCWLNAICYKKFVNPKSKIIFGKAGWLRKRDAEPYYEFGEKASPEEMKWLMCKIAHTHSLSGGKKRVAGLLRGDGRA
jgi:hypothetical protein